MSIFSSRRTLLVLVLAFSTVGGFAASAPTPLDALVQAMAASHDPQFHLHVLRGMNAALKGRHGLAAPAGWDALYATLRAEQNPEVHEQAQLLSAVFGGQGAIEDLRKTLADPAAKIEAREAALDSLVAAQDAGAKGVLLSLLREAGPLRRGALRGLANYNDPAVAPAILAVYGSLGGDEKREALSTLARRATGARALLASVDAGKVPRADLTAPFARQLQDLKDPGIEQWLKEHWGAIHTSSAEKQKEIARLKAFLTPERLAAADVNHGRALFSQTCAICHTIFGAGAKIGPELPGAFEDIDYLLLNIVDPNAIIGKDYQQTVVQTKGGQTVIGIIGAQDGSSVTLKTLGGPVLLQRGEIVQLSVLDVSLMPEGLLSAIGENDVRDLFGYLRLHGQVPALLSAANVNDFTNDAAFERWTRSSAAAWKAGDGQITGHGNADRPEFLTSDFIAEDFELATDLKITGPGAVAEIILRGESRDGGFTGIRLRFTGDEAAIVRYTAPQAATPAGQVLAKATNRAAGEWIHCQVTARQGHVQVKLGDSATLDVSDESLPHRTNFGLQIAGAQGELQVKAPKLELLRAK